MNTRTQRDRIRAHLKAGNSLTALDALLRWGCLRLASRVFELRRDEGLDIDTKYEHKRGKVYARYVLQ